MRVVSAAAAPLSCCVVLVAFVPFVPSRCLPLAARNEASLKSEAAFSALWWGDVSGVYREVYVEGVGTQVVLLSAAADGGWRLSAHNSLASRRSLEAPPGPGRRRLVLDRPSPSSRPVLPRLTADVVDPDHAGRGRKISHLPCLASNLSCGLFVPMSAAIGRVAAVQATRRCPYRPVVRPLLRVG